MNEFEIIRRYFTRSHPEDDIVLGIGDDGAVVRVPSGQDLVLAMDTLVNNIHFPESTGAAAIGWKALAVNLSDLAAMGASPRWATLSLTLPATDEEWLQAFANGFFELADQTGVRLIGGDLCRGPLAVTVQVHGLVPAGEAITRAGARSGDQIYVTGMLGDAGYALKQVTSGTPSKHYFRGRLERPQPRIALGEALRGLASSAIDISDGLAGDLRHIMEASSCGAIVHVSQLPLSKALQECVDRPTAEQYALAAGDDYELCFTVPPGREEQLAELSSSLDVAITAIGEITDERELVLRDAKGQQNYVAYTHFR